MKKALHFIFAPNPEYHKQNSRHFPKKGFRRILCIQRKGYHEKELIHKMRVYKILIK